METEQVTNREKPKYKYLVDFVPKEQLKECLKEAGENGWKLVKMKEVETDEVRGTWERVWRMVYIKKVNND